MPASLLSNLSLAFLISVAVIAYHCVERRNRAVSKLQCAPLEQAHWLWGHEYAIWSSEANVKHSQHSRWATILGPLYRIKAPLFGNDVVVTSDNTAAQHILQHCYRYVKAPEFRPTAERWLGKGVVWAEGDEHKHQRRLLAPAFTLAAVKGMTDDVIACVERTAIRLSKHLASQGGDAVVNLSPFISSCTLDIIGRIAFGHDFGVGISEDAQNIAKSWHHDVLLAHTFAGFFAPILLVKFPWIQKLPIAALKTDGKSSGKDILSILLDNQKHNRKESERLSDETLMVGHETTSCSIIFSLYELAGQPDVQEKLRREIHGLGSDLNYDSISNLSFLDAVIREGLRLHAPSARTDRVALEDDVIPLSRSIVTAKGQTITSLPIKAGQIIQIPTSVLNTDPEVWASSRDLMSGIASFLDGPRNCLGWRLAVLEFKVILALLIRDFSFERTGAKVEEFRAATTQAFVGDEVMMPLRVSLAQ
ncbi:cytochrome P450 [Desarmillaria tabescens]|uniref:Cytochrome P450 n=1 Tax=Armillaria tabescens TaxID=1929756 RepID=A0AA39MW15_ARMTA|nr:cytochrome P450 [Desarmillaria tabescens]KAK0447920.1 cytochrome P450 [Desarmillaria tabescens]